MEDPNTTGGQPQVGSDALFGDLRPLAKGDTVQRGDIFIADGEQYEMSRSGVVLGIQCLGQTIRKDNGGWHRPSPNSDYPHQKGG